MYQSAATSFSKSEQTVYRKINRGCSLLLTGFASAYYSFQFLWKTNDYGNRSRTSQTLDTFVMMGLTGTGGYNDADTQAVNQLPTQEAKKLIP